MPKCSVCKRNYEFPEGLTFVHVDGRVLHFCSSKCRKNYALGRKKMRWVAKQKGIDRIEETEENVPVEKSEKAGEKQKEEKAEKKEDRKEEKPVDKKEQKAEEKK